MATPIRTTKSTTKKTVKLYNCRCCNKDKNKSEFYMSSNPFYKSKITAICKDCARDIAKDENGEITRESVLIALEELDKPFIYKVWESSITETETATAKNKQDLFGNYMKNIAMNDKYLRYKDSDIFKQIHNLDDNDFKTEFDKNEEVAEMYEKNKKDTLRMIGYDPFMNELEADKPILYSKLVDFCDESTLDDGFKLNAIIEIVKSFNQAEKLNNAIATASENTKAIFENGGLIKQLTETKNKIISSALDLAKDNGISVIHNKDRSKGASTLTGKQKELTDIGLRDIQISMFDINTGEAMKQVAEISAKAQINQLRLDENDYTEIIIRQREINEDLEKRVTNAEEALRLFKVENSDLKEFLKENNLIDIDGKVRG